MKYKLNQCELTGNLVTDARLHGDLTFITIATWNGKDKDDNDLKPTYTDVVLYNIKQDLIDQLKKGQRVNLIGKLTNYTRKEKDGRNHRMTGVYAYKVNIIERNQIEKAENKEKENIFKDEEMNQKEPIQNNDWVIDLGVTK